jgi:hypothetical protein
LCDVKVEYYLIKRRGSTEQSLEAPFLSTKLKPINIILVVSYSSKTYLKKRAIRIKAKEANGWCIYRDGVLRLFFVSFKKKYVE